MTQSDLSLILVGVAIGFACGMTLAVLFSRTARPPFDKLLELYRIENGLRLLAEKENRILRGDKS